MLNRVDGVNGLSSRPRGPRLLQFLAIGFAMTILALIFVFLLIAGLMGSLAFFGPLGLMGFMLIVIAFFVPLYGLLIWLAVRWGSKVGRRRLRI